MDFLEEHGLQVLSFATLFLILVHLSPIWHTDNDSVAYLSIARHIASGQLLRCDSPHLLYTPTYSLLLAPAYLLPGPTFLWVYLIHGLIAVAVATGAWYWVRAYSASHAVLVALLTIVNIGIWSMHRVVRPETTYVAATLWAGGFLARAFQDPLHRKFWLYVLLGGVLAAFAAAVRPLPFVSVGAAAALIHMAVTKRIGWVRAFFAALIVAALSAAVMLTWMAYDRHATAIDTAPQLNDRVNWTYIDYVKDWGLHPVQALEGLRRQVGEVGRLLIPGFKGFYARAYAWLDPMNFVYAAYFVFVSVTWYRAACSTSDSLVWMIPPYFLVFVLSRHDQGTRYLVPLVPALWFCLTRYTFTRWKRDAAALILLIASLHLLVSFGDRVKELLEDFEVRKHWTPLEQLASRAGPAPAVSLGLKAGDPRMLVYMYHVNRGILPAEPGQGIPLAATQVFSSSPTPPEGFVLQDSAEGIYIHRRLPTSKPATQAAP